MINTPDNLIPADVELVGLDGNAMVVIAAIGRGLYRAGNDKAIVDAFYAEAMSGDYDHVLQTAMAYNGDLG